MLAVLFNGWNWFNIHTRGPNEDIFSTEFAWHTAIAGLLFIYLLVTYLFIYLFIYVFLLILLNNGHFLRLSILLFYSFQYRYPYVIENNTLYQNK